MTGCSQTPRDLSPKQQDIESAIRQVQARFAPADHLGFYQVGLEQRAHSLVLTGAVDCADARAATLEAVQRSGATVIDHIQVLPVSELGEAVWGIGCLSVSSGREQPEHKSEMGTQVLMGSVVHLLKPNTNRVWYLAQTADGYPAWFEKGTFVRRTLDQVRAWTNSPLLIVTAFEAVITEEPRADAAPVSDVVTANLVKRIGENPEWYKVELPDSRVGFLPKSAAEDYRAWLTKRRATAANIEQTARLFLGRPYLWGGNSPKGFDCSGFTKTVFYLNGLHLGRNASHQARQGQPVQLDSALTQVRPGDLLFFGRHARGPKPESIHHVAIYLGNKLFIHSSERVQINSLDPDSPIRDELRIRTLLRVRRILPPSA